MLPTEETLTPPMRRAGGGAESQRHDQRRRTMNITTSLRNWAKRNETARELNRLSQRQLEDIGAFEARNADRMRPFIRGL
jgi:uncharacterized protein YjiS (DUF1127 family)